MGVSVKAQTDAGQDSRTIPAGKAAQCCLWRWLQQGACYTCRTYGTIPSEHNPIPSEHNPIPSEHNTMPSEHNTIPSEHNTIPSEHNPIPSEHNPIPSEHKPIPFSIQLILLAPHVHSAM